MHDLDEDGFDLAAATRSKAGPRGCSGASYSPEFVRHLATSPVHVNDRKERSTMSLRQKKKLATRNALISTARRLFVEKGYENTTLEEICEEVQVHVTTFFAYFESKEELAFARTIEMLDLCESLLSERPPGVDVMTAWWKFFYDVGLRARGEEGTMMLRLDQVPALQNRYATIVRQYEKLLAAALAEEAGADPAADLYDQLLSSTLMAAIVSGARWQLSNFGPDAKGDVAQFAKMILANFPSRQSVEELQHNIARSNKRARKRPANTDPSPSRDG
jgi:AcrR family transcriptional regulator